MLFYLFALNVRLTSRLTCCISHSAKYKKTANFDPSGSQNQSIDLHEIWHGWLCPWPHPTCQIWWSSLNVCGLGACVKYHICDFFDIFVLFSSRPQVAFRNRSLRSIRRLFGQSCAFWRSKWWLTTFRGSYSGKTSKIEAWIETSQRKLSNVSPTHSLMYMALFNFYSLVCHPP